MKNKFLIFLLAISFYSFLFSLTYIVHIHFFRVNVIFYASLLDSLIALIFFLIIFLSSAMSKIYNYFELFAISCLLLFLGYSFSITVPTVIDRSLSFYYLEKIRQHDGAISKNSMRDIFTSDFVDEYKVVEMRLTEQLSSGTIIMKVIVLYWRKEDILLPRLAIFFEEIF